MKEFTQCIQKVPIFKNLNATEMDEVMALVKHNAYKKGDFLYAQTDQLNSLFVIHNGKVKITRYSNDGKETVIRILENGDFLGELALFSEQKANAYAEVLENSQICSINSDQIKKLLEKKPTIMFKMMNEISKRLSETEAMLEYKVTDNAETKVARLLLELTNDHLIILPTTKYTLEIYDKATDSVVSNQQNPPADIVGLTREEIIEYTEGYMEDMTLSEYNKGLLSYELLSFSADEVVMRKSYDSSSIPFMFYVVVKNGYVIVYNGDLKSVYRYTGIEASKLPENDRVQLSKGIYINTLDELYSLLESYTS